MSTWLDQTIVDELILLLVAGSALVCGLWAAGHALLHKRDPRSALVWVTLSLTVPLLGALAYWLLGINRITRRARRWQRRRRLLHHGDHSVPRGPSTVALPAQFSHLSDLVALGDRVARNRLLDGNRIEPLENGEGAYPVMLAAIHAARETINLSSYIFDGDGVGRGFVDALAAAARRGVAVRVLVDALGERYSTPTARQALAGSGVDLRLYLPLSQGPFINLRNHRKLLIIDGSTAFTGGMNIRSRHCIQQSVLHEATRDLHFRVQGPVVADLQRIFLEDWQFVSGELPTDPRLFPPLAPCGSAVVRAIGDGPDRAFRKLEWIVMGALSVARQRVRIMTPYFIPDRPMIVALTTAALRGVEISLVLPGHTNLPFVAWASRASYWELLKNGIRIFEQPAPFSHTKLFQVDDCWTLIGSANLDTRSLRLNFELNLSVFDLPFSAAIGRYFDQALASSRQVTLAEVDGRPLPIRLRDGVARLFSPYL
ncbi:MAG: phospholipase D-like domain-containing protein [Geobacter sp.]